MKRRAMFYNREKFWIYYTRDIYGGANIHYIEHSKSGGRVGANFPDYDEIYVRAIRKLESGK